MNVKLIAPIVTLASAFVLPPTSYGEATAACRTGELLDAREDTEYVLTVQVGRVHRNGNKDWTTVELPSTRMQMTYTVRVALVVTRPDGKQYKPTITRRERDQAASH